MYQVINTSSTSLNIDAQAQGIPTGSYYLTVVVYGAAGAPVKIQTSIIQSGVHDVVVPAPPSVSHTFIYDDTYLLPCTQTMTDVAAALNVNKESAHGTFGVDQNNNLTITCDDSWVWPTGFNPDWGTSSETPGSQSIDASSIIFIGIDWIKIASTKNKFIKINSYRFASPNKFVIGCFPT